MGTQGCLWGGKENNGRRELGRKGEREGWKEERNAGRAGGMEEGGRERGKEGEREEGREGWKGKKAGGKRRDDNFVLFSLTRPQRNVMSL